MLPSKGRNCVEDMCAGFCWSNPAAKSILLSPVMRNVCALLLSTRRRHAPGFGSRTLITFTLLMDRSSLRPLLTRTSAPVASQTKITIKLIKPVIFVFIAVLYRQVQHTFSIGKKYSLFSNKKITQFLISLFR